MKKMAEFRNIEDMTRAYNKELCAETAGEFIHNAKLLVLDLTDNTRKLEQVIFELRAKQVGQLKEYSSSVADWLLNNR